MWLFSYKIWQVKVKKKNVTAYRAGTGGTCRGPGWLGHHRRRGSSWAAGRRGRRVSAQCTRCTLRQSLPSRHRREHRGQPWPRRRGPGCWRCCKMTTGPVGKKGNKDRWTTIMLCRLVLIYMYIVRLILDWFWYEFFQASDATLLAWYTHWIRPNCSIFLPHAPCSSTVMQYLSLALVQTNLTSIMHKKQPSCQVRRGVKIRIYEPQRRAP